MKKSAKKNQRKPATGLRAVILAGGKGLRLKPYTANFPKPLMPLGDKPVVEILLLWLMRFGIKDVTLTLGHLAEMIRTYFHFHQPLSRQMKLRYVEEKEPTGTAGSLSLVRGLKETFLVMNGDLLTDLDLNKFIAFHRKEKAILTIAAHRRHLKIDFGVLEFDEARRITGYREKPEQTHHVSMGIYAYEPRVLKYIKPGDYLDLPDLVLKLIKAGEKVCAFPADCLWLDIGRPDDYAQAQELFAAKRKRFENV
jgi:NDP-sugar pyrophosphorylase family protein